MTVVAALHNCTSTNQSVTAQCCQSLGAPSYLAGNKCAHTDDDKFTTCVTNANDGLRAAWVTATDNGTHVPASMNRTYINNTHGRAYRDVTAHCWANKHNAARKARKEATLASLALIVFSVAAYTAM